MPDRPQQRRGGTREQPPALSGWGSGRAVLEQKDLDGRGPVEGDDLSLFISARKSDQDLQAVLGPLELDGRDAPRVPVKADDLAHEKISCSFLEEALPLVLGR